MRLLAERLATRRVDRYVCVSHSVADFCRDRAGLPAEKLTVIPNGIDINRFAIASPANLAELGVPPGRRAVCVVGRLDRQKNLQWLLAHSEEILAAAPRHDLVIVGDGVRPVAAPIVVGRDAQCTAGGDGCRSSCHRYRRGRRAGDSWLLGSSAGNPRGGPQTT
jgi:glycosyltransferase involved in cell wall biosynthesis